MGHLHVSDGQNSTADILDDHFAFQSILQNAVVHVGGRIDGVFIVIDLEGHGITGCHLDTHLQISHPRSIQFVVAIGIHGQFIADIHSKGNCLLVVQIQLIVGAIADIVRNAISGSLAVNEYRSAEDAICIIAHSNLQTAILISAHGNLGCVDDLIAQLSVDGPCLAVLHISILDGRIGLFAAGNTGRIVDTDGIQIQIVTIGCLNVAFIVIDNTLGLVHRCHISGGQLCSISVMGQTGNFQNGHLIQAVGGVVGNNPLATFELIAVIGVDDLLGNNSTATVLHLQCENTSGIAGQGDHVEAGTTEAKGCSTVGSGIHMNHGGAAQRILGDVGVSAVVTVNIVGVDHSVEAELDIIGAVLILSLTGGRTIQIPLTGHHTSLGNLGLYTSCRTICIISREGQELILIVDGGGGDDGQITIVCAIVFTLNGVGILDAVSEGIHIGHHHGGGRIADHGVFIGIAGCGSINHSRTKRTFRTLIIEGFSLLTLSGLSQLAGNNAGQLAVLTEHVVGQHMDIHRQTEVDDHSVTHGARLPLHGEPDGGVGILMVGIVVTVTVLIGVGITVVVGNIGAVKIIKAGGCAGNLPITGFIGVSLNGIVSFFIVQPVACRKNAGCSNSHGLKRRGTGIQKYFLIQGGAYDDGSVGEGNLHTVVVHRLTTGSVHQIESVADIGALPSCSGRYSSLLTGKLLIVVVIQNGIAVGIIGTGFAADINVQRAFQMDIVAQGQFGGADVADVPVEALGSQRSLGGTVAIHIDHLGTVVGGSLLVGVVEDILAADDAVAVEDVSITHQIGLCTAQGVRAVSVLGRLEGNDFQSLVLVGAILVGLAGTNLLCVFSAQRTISTDQFLTGPDLVGADFQHGVDGALVHGLTGGQVFHGSQLQIEGLTHFVHEVGVGGSQQNVGGEAGECTLQVGDRVNVEELFVIAGDGLQNGDLVFFGTLSTILQQQTDGVHGSTQALYGFQSTNAAGIEANDIFGVSDGCLDRLSRAVQLAVVIVITGIELRIINVRNIVAGIRIGIVIPTADPFDILVLAVIGLGAVVLRGRAVGQEQHELLTLGIAVGLLLGQQVIGHLQTVVVVGTGAGGDIARIICSVIAIVGNTIGCPSSGDLADLFPCTGEGLVTGLNTVTCSSGTGSADLVGARLNGVAVKGKDGNVNIGIRAVLTLGLHLLDQLVNSRTQQADTFASNSIAIFICKCERRSVFIHGTGSIQNDDHVHAFVHGDTGSGQLHGGGTGGLEVNTGSGLVDLHGAGVGVSGILAAGLGVDGQGEVIKSLAVIGDGQSFVSIHHGGGKVTAQHAHGDGNTVVLALVVLHIHQDVSAGLSSLGSALVDSSLIGLQGIAKDGSLGNNDLGGAEGLALVGDGHSILAGNGAVVGRIQNELQFFGDLITGHIIAGLGSTFVLIALDASDNHCQSLLADSAASHGESEIGSAICFHDLGVQAGGGLGDLLEEIEATLGSRSTKTVVVTQVIIASGKPKATNAIRRNSDISLISA